jgi:hypothetical protein
VAYEVFERRVIRVEQPVLSVLPDGRLTLNAAATRLVQKAGIRTVRILWDKLSCGIALQPCEKGDKNSYTIAFSRGRSASISLKAFLTFIGWSCNRRQPVSARWNPQQKMLEAVLPSRFVGKRKQETTAQEEDMGL